MACKEVSPTTPRGRLALENMYHKILIKNQNPVADLIKIKSRTEL
jgi:hypothetical protein